MRIRTLLIVLGAMLLVGGCSQFTKSSDTKVTEQDVAKMEEQLAQMKEKLAGEKAAAEQAAKEAPHAGRAAPKKHAAPAPAVRRVTLDPGTPIVVRTTSTISTKAARAGERFTASLEEPLMAGRRIVARKGALVEGVVVESNEGGRVKGKAALAVTLSSLTTGTGERVEIATNTIGNQAKSAKKKDAAKVGIGAAAGAIIGAIAGGGKGAAIGAGVGAGAGGAGVLLTRGNAAEIPSETVLQFELIGPATVTVK